jgi:hypothetical protein
MPDKIEVEDIAREFGAELDCLIEQSLSEGDGSKEVYAAIAAVLTRDGSRLAAAGLPPRLGRGREVPGHSFSERGKSMKIEIIGQAARKIVREVEVAE